MDPTHLFGSRQSLVLAEQVVDVVFWRDDSGRFQRRAQEVGLGAGGVVAEAQLEVQLQLTVGEVGEEGGRIVRPWVEDQHLGAVTGHRRVEGQAVTPLHARLPSSRSGGGDRGLEADAAAVLLDAIRREFGNDVDSVPSFNDAWADGRVPLRMVDQASHLADARGL
ncbi:hypothetical protein O3S80_20635 [Streptomyces sp. Lzd4kr]|nr:hypothetical protein [Streptomyces sp. Lzd4kr]